MAAYKIWCPVTDSSCPKRTSQLGSYPSEKAARSAVEHHLTHSSHHYMNEEDAKWLAEAAIFENVAVDEFHGVSPAQKKRKVEGIVAPSQPPLPKRSNRELVASLQRAEEALRQSAMVVGNAATHFRNEAENMRHFWMGLE